MEVSRATPGVRLALCWCPRGAGLESADRVGAIGLRRAGSRSC